MHEALLQIGYFLLILFAGGFLARRLGLSVIPAYVLAGLLIREFAGGSELFAVPAEIGLLLLLFFIGLEFDFGSLVHSWKRTVASGLIDFSLSFPAGIAFGLIMGAGVVDSFFMGAIVYMTSTAIVTKTIVDNRLTAMPESEVILRLCLFQDVIIALFLAVFTSLSVEVSPSEPVIALLKAGAFFMIFWGITKLGVKHINKVFAVESRELFIMLGLGFIIMVAWAASLFGISSAIGAFLAGTLLSQTEHRGRVEEGLAPVKDLFAAVFFLHFGMSIGVSGAVPVLAAALALTAVGILTKLFGGGIIGRVEKLSDRATLGVGVGLLARGEFSIIAASLLVSRTAGSEMALEIQSVAAVFVLFTGILGTVAMKEYPKVYMWWKNRPGSAK